MFESFVDHASGVLLEASILLAAGVFAALVGWVVARVPSLQRPTTGIRGEMRRRALAESAALRSLEPLLSKLGGVVRTLRCWRPLARPGRWWVETQERVLTVAGRVWGLDADELLALSVLSGTGFSALVASTSSLLDAGVVWIAPAAAFGAALPNLQLQSVTAGRFKSATRNLPAAIDLCTLCMSAGADFAQALRYIVEGGDDLIAEEFRRVLNAMEIGQTRRTALQELAQRLPVEPVRDLVRALVQAEEKGNPLAEALANQAKMSRLRRSVAAEEAAARAGVLMIVPLMLLLGCVVLLLLGPFIVTGGGL